MRRHVAKHVLGVLFLLWFNNLTGLWASIGIMRSSSSRPFLCALVLYNCNYYIMQIVLNDIIILGGHMSVREVSRCECWEAYVAETRAPRDMPTR